MRIALLSDIHGNLAALEAVVADARRRGVDEFINLGDSLSGPLMPLETAQFLMDQGWITLAGNHERQLLTPSPRGREPSDDYAFAQLSTRELHWLRSLPAVYQYAEDIFLCHGTPVSDTQYWLETVESTGLRMAHMQEIEQRAAGRIDALMACGHTHLPRVVRMPSGQRIVNPGSVGLPAYDDVHPYLHYVETASPDARYAVIERVGPSWIVDLIAVPYNHFAMANLAARNGRPDWQYALATGYALRVAS